MSHCVIITQLGAEEGVSMVTDNVQKKNKIKSNSRDSRKPFGNFLSRLPLTYPGGGGQPIQPPAVYDDGACKFLPISARKASAIHRKSPNNEIVNGERSR